ncbi:amidohydrolase family protein [Amycolatopsis taiwanensis]|uniref:amidohydrolase family protein n=1 Tax=Amycolatopsis taiwanensis TaxID=342230 RepID=UPI0004BCDD71|nr:amidohydrolase family protein [Amycolatopsis taiwanensis]
MNEAATELLRGGRRSDGTAADFRVSDGVVVEVGTLSPRAGEPVTELDGRLVLPAFAEPHVHLDKAFTASRVVNATGNLGGAMASYAHLAANGKRGDIQARARRALGLFVAAGVTAVRAQIGAGPLSGVSAIEALAELRSSVADYVDLQIVAHAAVPPGGPAAHRALLLRALDAGADHLGGNPFLEEDPQRAFQTCLQVATERGCELDLHVDESFDSLTFDQVVAGAHESGVRIVAAHCVSLSRLPLGQLRELAASAAAAGVSVVTLPMTNLFLQGREQESAKPRGLTAISPLRAAGVLVAAGSDNVQDPFNPVGRCDPLEIASLLVTAGHQTVADAVTMVGPDARQVLSHASDFPAIGSPADLVAIAAADLGDAVAGAPADRLVWRRGRLVARTSTTAEIPF